MRPANVRGGPFRDAVGGDLAGLDRTRHRADAVGDRRLRVEAVHLEQIYLTGNPAVAQRNG